VVVLYGYGYGNDDSDGAKAQGMAERCPSLN